MSDSIPPPSVRMKGFAKRSSVDEAWQWIQSERKLLPSEWITLADSCGRILADDLISPMNVPAFDRSAMDGYAIRAEESTGASPASPVTLKLSGEVLAGQAPACKVSTGQAVRIMTGAALPPGADAVIPVEQTESISPDLVEIQATVSPWKHVSRVGEDVGEKEVVLKAGRQLRPQDTGMIASLGMNKVPVIRQPRVRIVISGNELIPPGQPRQAHQIFEANSFLLQSLIKRDAAVLESLQFVADTREEIEKAILSPGADVILVSGGTSVGQEDFVPEVVQQHGELAIHGIAMRPSSPAGMGKVCDSLVFLLPGNPVSCLCAYDFFASRAIRQLVGDDRDWSCRFMAGTLSSKVSSVVGRTDYCRVKITGEWEFAPVAISGAAILSSTVQADGFLVVPENSEGLPAGAQVSIGLYDC